MKGIIHVVLLVMMMTGCLVTAGSTGETVTDVMTVGLVTIHIDIWINYSCTATSPDKLHGHSSIRRYQMVFRLIIRKLLFLGDKYS